MIWDILTGAALGGLFVWAGFAGVFAELSRMRGNRLSAAVPRSFWRLSAYFALVGVITGAIVMWLGKR